MRVDRVRRALRVTRQTPREASPRTTRKQAEVARRFLVRPTRKA